MWFVLLKSLWLIQVFKKCYVHVFIFYHLNWMLQDGMFIFIFYFLIYALNFHILKGLVNLFKMRIPALHLLNTLHIFSKYKKTIPSIYTTNGKS